MNELKKLLNDIEQLRINLYELINKKNADLSDPDIVSVSMKLNAEISRYTEFTTKKPKYSKSDLMHSDDVSHKVIQLY